MPVYGGAQGFWPAFNEAAGAEREFAAQQQQRAAEEQQRHDAQVQQAFLNDMAQKRLGLDTDALKWDQMVYYSRHPEALQTPQTPQPGSPLSPAQMFPTRPFAWPAGGGGYGLGSFGQGESVQDAAFLPSGQGQAPHPHQDLIDSLGLGHLDHSRMAGLDRPTAETVLRGVKNANEKAATQIDYTTAQTDPVTQTTPLQVQTMAERIESSRQARDLAKQKVKSWEETQRVNRQHTMKLTSMLDFDRQFKQEREHYLEAQGNAQLALKRAEAKRADDRQKYTGQQADGQTILQLDQMAQRDQASAQAQINKLNDQMLKIDATDNLSDTQKAAAKQTLQGRIDVYRGNLQDLAEDRDTYTTYLHKLGTRRGQQTLQQSRQAAQQRSGSADETGGPGTLKPMTRDQVMYFMRAAGGDAKKARAMAIQRGLNPKQVH